MNLLFFAQLLLAGLMPNLSDTLTISKQDTIDVAVVTGGWAYGQTPVTHTVVYNSELFVSNPVNSLPMSLVLQPSVVVTNEGGTGLGYSKMTVRGSKGTQINVTLNGITLNDSESQEVFWVNIPSLTRLLNSVLSSGRWCTKRKTVSVSIITTTWS